ncbi:MAG: PKD domain-containing protein, partial [Planctomycetota bacterium]
GTVEPPANWNDLGFDDSSWLLGPTGIGYSSDVSYPTVLNDMGGGGYASFYVRRTFDIPRLSSVIALELGLQYDDGFIAYINGHEIARSINMTQSFYAHNDYIGSGHDESLPEEVFLIDAADIPSLVAGENVIAIQVQNTSVTSSDACIVPRLTLLDSSGPTAVITADNISADQAPLTVNFSGADSIDDSAIVDYQWDFGDGSAVVSGTQSSVAHTYTEEGRFTATLTVTDDDGLTGSDSVGIAVGATGYEGFGTVTRGAEDAPGGYQTYHVTSLANSGTGTLRDAISQGSRHIVFDVGGTIRLSGSLYIRSSYITIDGATAPSPGITISIPTGDNFILLGEVHDVIINNIRADGNYIGPVANQGDVGGLDGMYGSGPVSNIIIDHCTFTSAGDGVFDTRGSIENVTYSWNLFKDTDFMGSFGDPGYRRGISFHHNVLARGGERMPKIENEEGATTTQFDMVNNVVYGWGTPGWTGNYGLAIRPSGWLLELHVTNNWYEDIYGSGSNALTFSGSGHQVDFEGNVFPSNESDDVDSATLPPPIPQWARVTTYDTSTLGDTVVPFVGTHYPTAGERDLLNEVSAAIGGRTCSVRFLHKRRLGNRPRRRLFPVR